MRRKLRQDPPGHEVITSLPSQKTLALAWENDPDDPVNRRLARDITASGGGPEDGGLHPRDCNCDACCDAD